MNIASYSHTLVDQRVVMYSSSIIVVSQWIRGDCDCLWHLHIRPDVCKQNCENVLYDTLCVELQ